MHEEEMERIRKFNANGESRISRPNLTTVEVVL
jgi:hypothetical protein